MLAAGLDTDCGSWFDDNLVTALDTGAITMAQIDQALIRLTAVQMRLGYFDPPEEVPFSSIGPEDVNWEAHQQLGLDAAREGITLLKNEGSLLPLDLEPPRPLTLRTTTLATPTPVAADVAYQATDMRLHREAPLTFAVVGPNANATDTLLGNYFGPAPFLISALAGIQTALDTVGGRAVYAQGCSLDDVKMCMVNATGRPGAHALSHQRILPHPTVPHRTHHDINPQPHHRPSDPEVEDSLIAEAATAATEADFTVMVLGLCKRCEKEGKDRYDLLLPNRQPDLVEAVLAATKVPVVMVVVGGGGVDLSAYVDDARVGAIVFAGYPGESGGTAIADVLFGNVSPSGRLTQTFYSNAFLGEVSMTDMAMRPHDSSPGRTYRFYEGPSVVYPFGHGLSYTSFEYNLASAAVVSRAALGTTGGSTHDVEVAIDVRNAGSRAGAETVLVYLVPPPGLTGQPLKSLRGFEKVWLEPGESATVRFAFGDADFSLADHAGAVAVVGGTWRIVTNNDEVEVEVEV